MPTRQRPGRRPGARFGELLSGLQVLNMLTTRCGVAIRDAEAAVASSSLTAFESQVSCTRSARASANRRWNWSWRAAADAGVLAPDVGHKFEMGVGTYEEKDEPLPSVNPLDCLVTTPLERPLEMRPTLWPEEDGKRPMNSVSAGVLAPEEFAKQMGESLPSSSDAPHEAVAARLPWRKPP